MGTEKWGVAMRWGYTDRDCMSSECMSRPCFSSTVLGHCFFLSLSMASGSFLTLCKVWHYLVWAERTIFSRLWSKMRLMNSKYQLVIAESEIYALCAQ